MKVGPLSLEDSIVGIADICDVFLKRGGVVCRQGLLDGCEPLLEFIGSVRGRSTVLEWSG